jgi:hypothetical protein
MQAPAISLCEHPLCSMENIFSCICLENGFGILEHWNRGSIQWRWLYIQVVNNVFTKFYKYLKKLSHNFVYISSHPLAFHGCAILIK